MSRERLTQLVLALEKVGWEVKPAEDNLSLFNFDKEEDDVISWFIVRKSGLQKQKLIIIAQDFKWFGQKTNDINSVYYCYIEENEDLKLYFDKINSKEWQMNLKDFIGKVARL